MHELAGGVGVLDADGASEERELLSELGILIVQTAWLFEEVPMPKRMRDAGMSAKRIAWHAEKMRRCVEITKELDRRAEEREATG